MIQLKIAELALNKITYSLTYLWSPKPRCKIYIRNSSALYKNITYRATQETHENVNSDIFKCIHEKEKHICLCNNQEITGLYFNLCGRKSSVLQSQIEFTQRRAAELGNRIFATVKPRSASAKIKIQYSYLHSNAILRLLRCQYFPSHFVPRLWHGELVTTLRHSRIYSFSHLPLAQNRPDRPAFI